MKKTRNMRRGRRASPAASHSERVVVCSGATGNRPINKPTCLAQSAPVVAATFTENRSDLVAASQLLQEPPVDGFPDSSCLPGMQIPPATHSGATPHLLREHFTGNAAREDEEGAYETPPRIHRLAAEILPSSWLGRRQCLADFSPELVRDRSFYLQALLPAAASLTWIKPYRKSLC